MLNNLLRPIEVSHRVRTGALFVVANLALILVGACGGEELDEAFIDETQSAVAVRSDKPLSNVCMNAAKQKISCSTPLVTRTIATKRSQLKNKRYNKCLLGSAPTKLGACTSAATLTRVATGKDYWSCEFDSFTNRWLYCVLVIAKEDQYTRYTFKNGGGKCLLGTSSSSSWGTCGSSGGTWKQTAGPRYTPSGAADDKFLTSSGTSVYVGKYNSPKNNNETTWSF